MLISPRSASPLGKAPFVSYAQNYEDVLLWRALHEVGTGCYLDVGAGEPDADSVTRAFYERAWRGVNVEPLPGPFARLQASRPNDVNLNVAAGAAAGETTLYVIGNESGLSTLDPVLAARHRANGWESREIHARVATLAEICAAHVDGELHFLKVDAEGAELDVLRGADFSRWRPWIVLVEALDPVALKPQHEAWEAEVLTPHGYRCAWFDGLNRFYLAAEREGDLAGAFRVPPNVFDCFVRVAEAEAVGRLDAARAGAEAADSRAEAAQARVIEFEAQIADLKTQIAGVNQELTRAAEERDAWAQELFESNRHAAELTLARQVLLEEQVRLHGQDARRIEEIAALRDHETRLLRVVSELHDHETRLLREVAKLTEAYQALLEEQARLNERDAQRSAHVAAMHDHETELLKEVSALRDHETRLLREVSALRDHEARLLQEVAGLKVERDEARTAAEDGMRWQRAVRGSLSWRLTAPVRLAGRFVRRRS